MVNNPFQENPLSLPDFYRLEADNLHTGHNRTEALHYAACNPEPEQVDD
jgi:hypothetical protein